MNRREHLLTVLGEECSELHKETCKILRFGYNSEKRGRLQAEFNEILALVQMLANEGISIYEQKHLIQDKKEKVEAMLLESQALGTLDE